jgi:hypothetical protein
MHWLCFHLEYEHDADPDEPCGDIGSCPWWQIKFLKQELVRLGSDPEEALERALKKALTRRSPHNKALPLTAR